MTNPLQSASALLDHLSDPFISLDADGRIRYINPAAEHLFHLPPHQIPGSTFWVVCRPALCNGLQEHFERSVAEQRALEFELFEAPVRRWWCVKFYPDSDRGASLLLKTMEKGEDIFRTAFAYAPVGMVITAPDGKFIEANEAYVQMLGYTRDELASGDSARFTHPEDVAKTHRYGEALRQGQSRGVLEKRYIRKDGQLVWARASGSMRYDADGHPIQFVAVIEDITERKRMEQALSISEQKLQQVFAQAPVGIVVLKGPEFVIELMNPTYQAMLPGRALVGRRFIEVLPDLPEAVWESWRHVLNTGEPLVQSETYIPYDIDADGVIEDHWFNAVFHPLRESDNTVSGIVAVCTDVTAQVLARRKLEIVNRGLEEFAYVASHDLQQPLRTVHSYTQLLLRRLAPHITPEVEEFASYIRFGVRRMEELIRDLLAYSQAAQLQDDVIVTHAELASVLRRAILLNDADIAETRAELTISQLPTVVGDEAQLVHVFQNLLSNALKYRKPGATPCIAIDATQGEDEWIVSVKDNGIGFDPQYSERIFGLFKRLHREEEYPGTGLGLAICKRIVERLGGRMWAESTQGTGSTFYFSLPAPPRA